jgi:hypothetical protein
VAPEQGGAAAIFVTAEEGLTAVCKMEDRWMGHVGRASVFGLVGESAVRARLMCGLYIPTSNVINGEQLPP